MAFISNFDTSNSSSDSNKPEQLVIPTFDKINSYQGFDRINKDMMINRKFRSNKHSSKIKLLGCESNK